MKKFKFRGLAVKDHNGNNIEPKIVYGNIWVSEDGKYVIIGEREGQMCYNYEVEPESVRQLVGVDKNGREVYDGDQVINQKGDPVYAYMRPYWKALKPKHFPMLEDLLDCELVERKES